MPLLQGHYCYRWRPSGKRDGVGRVLSVSLVLLISACSTPGRDERAPRPSTSAASKASGSLTSRSPTPATPTDTSPRCDAAALDLGYGGRVSPATGERAVVYKLINTTARPCHLFGFPGVSFYDRAGHVMPVFKFQRDHSQYILNSHPQVSVLSPQGAAYFEAAAYRCDQQIDRAAVKIRIYPPGSTTFLEGLATPARGRRDGAIAFTSCGPRRNDPGNLVSVGPVEPTEGAVFDH